MSSFNVIVEVEVNIRAKNSFDASNKVAELVNKAMENHYKQRHSFCHQVKTPRVVFGIDDTGAEIKV